MRYLNEIRYWLSEKIFKFWIWFGKRCYYCEGHGCGTNWQGIPMECPKCGGSGFREE